MNEDRSVVPCNGCTACCKRERIVLLPAQGDDPSQYETVPATLSGALCEMYGLKQNNAVMLQHKPNGDCIYLGDSGCTIWDRAPALCKAFDCRKWFLKFSRAERRKLLAKGHLDREVIRAGAARVDTLTEDEVRAMVLIHGITDDHQ